MRSRNVYQIRTRKLFVNSVAYFPVLQILQSLAILAGLNSSKKFNRSKVGL
jgi:hypothetical protein